MSAATATETNNRMTAERREAGIVWPDLGRICVSRGLHDAIISAGGCVSNLVPYLDQHMSRDWGELDEEDRAANDDAIYTGARILSAYRWRGEKIWIITEAVGDDGRRACTTILFPSEY